MAGVYQQLAAREGSAICSILHDRLFDQMLITRGSKYYAISDEEARRRCKDIGMEPVPCWRSGSM